ncbi:MAG: IS1 family transposase [Nitrososphaerota archaeon]|nr:IS1 family transposase [Nitrososphaerota archaeon]
MHAGKRNTWRIEHKHLTFCTRLKRLARKTSCCSNHWKRTQLFLDYNKRIGIQI